MRVPSGRVTGGQQSGYDGGPTGEEVQEKTEMDGAREADSAVYRLAVPELPVDGGLDGGHDGRHHGGCVEHTAGHGVLDSGQCGANGRTVHGRVPGAGVQPVGHVPAYITGRLVRSVPDDR